MPTKYTNPIKGGEFLPTLKEVVDNAKPQGIPKEAAWIWGPEDEVSVPNALRLRIVTLITKKVGRLNLLTPEHVKSVVASEPQHGLVCSLNWDVTLPRRPGFGRQACEVGIETLPGLLVNDEILHMNTQSGSQLDGLRHVAHMDSGLFYNNLRQEEIVGGHGGGGKSTRCGIQAASRRGIVGRGVLLDFARWNDEVGGGVACDPFETRGISLDELLAVAQWEGVEFQRGDVLLVRTGWMRKYNACLATGKEDELDRAAAEHPQSIGVEPSEEMKAWLHDQYFAVVGGDQPAFEVWPPREKPILHEYLLACWGVMIGEMLDLEHLSEICRKTGKYSFLFTSAPMNIPGGVASLANALCII